MKTDDPVTYFGLPIVEHELPDGAAVAFVDADGNVLGVITSGATLDPPAAPASGLATTIDRDWRNEPNRPPGYALGRHRYPVERRPGWLCEEDRWTGEWVYTREVDGAEVRIMQGGTWDDADIDLDIFEAEHPVKT